MTALPPTTQTRTASSLFLGEPWQGVARILDRAASVAGLRAHGLHLLAVARLRERGQPIPSELLEEMRVARFSWLAAATVLRRVAAAVSAQPILVMKGPEVAAHYPAPGLRPFRDVDILVPDPESAHRALCEAGFEVVGPDLDWSTMHHLPQLAAPDLPVILEVHRHPKQIRGLPGPKVDELLADAVPSALGIEGLLAPHPARHAVLLVANAWSERPLERALDLVDVAAVTQDGWQEDAAALASEYGLARAWNAMAVASDALLYGRRRSKALKTWARSLPAIRERTVVESHLARTLGPFSGLPIAPALRNAAIALATTARPSPGEGWREKLRRSRSAFRHAFVGRSEHERMLDSRVRGRS